jgi:hypothetical protein
MLKLMVDVQIRFGPNQCLSLGPEGQRVAAG